MHMSCLLRHFATYLQGMLKSRNVVKLETQIIGLAALGLTIPVCCSPSPVHG